MMELRILRLTAMDLRLVLSSGKFLAFAMLAVLPTLVTFYVAGLFWVPQSWQNLRLLELTNPGREVYELVLDEYLEVVKGFSEMILGFWAGFPMLVMTSLVVSDFIAGERASGTFDLLATKPVRRYELVASKLIVFLASSIPLLLFVHTINVLIVALSFYSGLGAGEVLRALWDSREYIAYYTIASWLYVLAASALTIFLSIWTKRGYLAVMGAVGYYIALGTTAGIVQGVVGGRTGKLIAELLGYADFSYHTRVVLYEWIHGSLEALQGRILPASYPLSLAILVGIPLLLYAIALRILEDMDLT